MWLFKSLGALEVQGYTGIILIFHQDMFLSRRHKCRTKKSLGRFSICIVIAAGTASAINPVVHFKKELFPKTPPH